MSLTSQWQVYCHHDRCSPLFRENRREHNYELWVINECLPGLTLLTWEWPCGVHGTLPNTQHSLRRTGNMKRFYVKTGQTTTMHRSVICIFVFMNSFFSQSSAFASPDSLKLKKNFYFILGVGKGGQLAGNIHKLFICCRFHSKTFNQGGAQRCSKWHTFQSGPGFDTPAWT